MDPTPYERGRKEFTKASCESGILNDYIEVGVASNIHFLLIIDLSCRSISGVVGVAPMQVWGYGTMLTRVEWESTTPLRYSSSE